MNRKIYCTLAIALSMCAPAFAAVIGTSSVVLPPFTTDTTLTGHKGYVLGLVSDSGPISAIDITIGGQLHQRWAFNADTELFDPTPSSTNITNGDSHLRPVTGALVGSALTENNNVSPSPLADTAARDYGYGNILRGAWGIPGASQTNTATLAYIVIPDGSEPTLQISAQVATPGGTFALNGPAAFGIASVVENPILTSNPIGSLPTVELDFGMLPTGQNPAPLPIALSNTGTGSPITITSITLAGGDASKFVLTGTLPTSLGAGDPAQSFGVDWNAPGTGPGFYAAQVLVNTSAGNLVFDVTAQVPEPATLALAGLALVGLVGFTRRK